MECKTIRELIPDYICGALEPEIKERFDTHILSCERCRNEVNEMSGVWSAVERIPLEEPGDGMRKRFDIMLETYREGLNGTAVKESWFERVNRWLGRLLPRRPVFQLGTTIAFLLIGLVIGKNIDSGAKPNGEMALLKVEMQEMRQEMQENRQLATLALLNRPSAVERLRGVSMSRSVNDPDDRFLSALLRTLNNDPNVNVRIAAVYALYGFSGQQWVRDELVESLSRQTSPLVQISMIDLMTALRERKATDVLKSIVNNEHSIEPVRKRAQTALDTII